MDGLLDRIRAEKGPGSVQIPGVQERLVFIPSGCLVTALASKA